MTMSGVLVQVLPKNLDTVYKDLEDSGLCDVFHKDEKGKIIIVLEGENTGEEIQKLKIIQEMPNILSADMIQSNSEEELNQLIDDVEIMHEKNHIAEFLNQDNVNPKDIIYKGDLKKKEI